MRRRVALALLIFSALSFAEFAAYAETPDAAKALKEAKEELESSQQKEKELAQQRHKLESELHSLQRELVDIATQIRRNEGALLDSEKTQSILNEQLALKEKELLARKTELEAMVSSAIRLSKAPPEAAVMMPGDFQEMLKASRTLSQLTETIRTESESIHEQLKELQGLKNKAEDNRVRVEAGQKELKRQQDILQSRLDERRKLSDELQKEEQVAQSKVKELSRKSTDLQELVSNLVLSRQKAEEERAKAEQEARERAEAIKARPKRTAPRTMKSVKSAKGKLLRPVAGKIRRSFGETIQKGVTSKGVLLKGRKEATVVAPYDGEVVFTGPFLNYGKIVILRHADEFHTLLAGFKDINVSVGEFLLEGEPIGVMGSNSDDTDLYIELRRQNQPIDPSPWFAGL